MNMQKDPLADLDNLQPLEPMPKEVYSTESSVEVLDAVASLESVYTTLADMDSKQQQPSNLTIAMMRHIVADCQGHVANETSYSFESDNYFERTDVKASMESIGRVILNTIKEIIRRIVQMVKKVGSWFRNTFSRVKQMHTMGIELTKRIRQSRLQPTSAPYMDIQVTNLLCDGKLASGMATVLGCRTRIQAFAGSIRILASNRGFELAQNAAQDLKTSRDIVSTMEDYRSSVETFIGGALGSFTDDLLTFQYTAGKPQLARNGADTYILASHAQAHQAILPLAEACVNILDQVLKYNNDWTKRDRLTMDLTRLVEDSYKAQRGAQAIQEGSLLGGVAKAQEARSAFLLTWESYLTSELTLVELATEAAREGILLAKRLWTIHQSH